VAARIRKLHDDKKSFFLSLLYLQAEAGRSTMTSSGKHLEMALDAAIKDLDGDPALVTELKSIRLFVEKALALSQDELSALLELLDWYEDMGEPSAEKIDRPRNKTGKEPEPKTIMKSISQAGKKQRKH
jgi:hypothetical protein